MEYLTPGAAESVELLLEAVPADCRLVVDVASGKGEGACTIAARLGCRVLAVDPFPPFVKLAAAKARTRGLDHLVQQVRGSGLRLPLPDSACDAGVCIGAPSIVGLRPAISELARVVRPGGTVVVSDIVFRTIPPQPTGTEWGWIAEIEQLEAGEYARTMGLCGLHVERTVLHDRAAWEAYHAPMLEVAAEARATGDTRFASRAEEGVDLERRGLDQWIDYATFIARVA